MSTQKEMLAMVRKLIADEQATGFTEGGNLEEPEGTQELLNYLDRAVDEYSKRQYSAGDVRLLKGITITNGMSVPDDFLGFAGVIPVKIKNNIMNWKYTEYNGEVGYFARLPYVSAYSENATLPYDKEQYISITALAAIYALNKHEYNVSQDLALLGMGGGVQNGNAE